MNLLPIIVTRKSSSVRVTDVSIKLQQHCKQTKIKINNNEMQRKTSVIALRNGTETVYETREFKVLVAEGHELLASLHLSGCKRKHFKWLFVLLPISKSDRMPCSYFS